MKHASLPKSGGWRVKNKEVLQSGAPVKFWVGGAKIFKKGTFLVEKTLLTNAKNLRWRKFLLKNLNEHQKINKHKGLHYSAGVLYLLGLQIFLIKHRYSRKRNVPVANEDLIFFYSKVEAAAFCAWVKLNRL